MFNRTFGIEIEAFNADRYAVAASLVRAGINAEVQYYNHATSEAWKIVTDGSIQGNNGFEVVSPILQGEEGLRQVRVVMQTLENLGAKVNKSCGLHVHFGANDLSLKQFKNLFKRWTKFEDIIDGFMPESRRADSNNYLKSIQRKFNSNYTYTDSDRAEAINKAFDAIDECKSLQELYGTVARCDRYFKLNIGSYWRYGTVEFRHHSGTVEAEKAINWILFAGEFLETSIKTNSRKERTADSNAGIAPYSWRFTLLFFPGGRNKAKESDLHQNLYNYYRDRAKTFGTWGAA